MAASTWTRGAASSEAPMVLSARRSSSAPVTALRTRRTVPHFSASASSRQSSGTAGMSVRWIDVPGPCRSSHASSMVKGRIGASQAVRWP